MQVSPLKQNIGDEFFAREERKNNVCRQMTNRKKARHRHSYIPVIRCDPMHVDVAAYSVYFTASTKLQAYFTLNYQEEKSLSCKK